MSYPDWILERSFGGLGVAVSPLSGAKSDKWPAGTHTPLKASVGLLGEVLEEQTAHGAFEADMQLRNLALRNSYNRNALKLHLLEKGRDMLLVSAYTVETFCHNNVEHIVTGIF